MTKSRPVQSAHAEALHFNAFSPSSGKMGIKLNNPKNAFTRAPNNAGSEIAGNASAIDANAVAIAKFASGPAREMRPFCFFEILFP